MKNYNLTGNSINGIVSLPDVEIEGDLRVSGSIIGLTNETVATAVFTNTTTTNAFINNGNIANLTGTNSTITNLINTNLTSANSRITNLTSANNLLTNINNFNITSTNISNNSITSANARITSLFSTSISSSNAIITNLTNTNLTNNTLVVSNSIIATGNNHTIGSITISGANVNIGTTVGSSTLTINSSIRTSINNHTIGSLFMTAGNIGIGTNNPSARFHVNGNTNLIGTAYIENNLIAVGSNNTIGSINVSGGNVGIGTISSIGTLTISKSSAPSLYISTPNYTFLPASNTDVGSIRFQHDNVQGDKNLDIRATVRSGEYMPSFSVWTSPAFNVPLANRFIITESGNVGIGTTSPTGQLSLGSSIQNKKIVLYEGSGDNTFYGFGINPSVLRYQIESTGAFHIFYAGVDANNSRELMRITGTGNVGINAVTPTAKLHIYDTTNGVVGLALEGGLENSSTQPFIRFGTSNIAGGTQGYAYISTDLVGSGAFGQGGRLNLFTKVGGTLTYSGLTVNQGNVGIKTITPFALLDVADGSDNGGAFGGPQISLQYRSSAGGGFRHFIGSRHDGAVGNGNGIDFYINNSSSASGSSGLGVGNINRMSITNNGVGIGTTSPAGELHVANSSSTTLLYIGRVSQVNDTYVAIGTTSLQNGKNYIDSVGASLVSYGDLLLNRFGGNVGIGTTNPTATLDVNGNFEATGSLHTLGSMLISGANMSVGINTTTPTWPVSPLTINAGKGLLQGLTIRSADGTPNGQAGESIRRLYLFPYEDAVGGTSIGYRFVVQSGSTTYGSLNIDATGQVGIITTAPSYDLHLANDSAAKPSTNTWTISSDARIKTNITMANLDTCYNNVKSIPLKRYTWRDEIYTHEQVPDRSKLGWIAQDVENILPKSVEQKNMYGIEDCRTLNSDQIIACMYGALQKVIEKLEQLESN